MAVLLFPTDDHDQCLLCFHWSHLLFDLYIIRGVPIGPPLQRKLQRTYASIYLNRSGICSLRYLSRHTIIVWKRDDGMKFKIFIDFYDITAYNISEQRNLLDLSSLLLWVQPFNLSASQLKMQIVNFREISILSPCFVILRRIQIYYSSTDKYSQPPCPHFHTDHVTRKSYQR